MEQSREISKIRYTRHRTKTNNEEWNSPEKLARLGSSVRYRRKTTGFKIIILLLTIFDGIMGCQRNGLSEQWAVGIMGRRNNGMSE